MISRQRSVFITGGLGYIGGRCARYLVENGYRVIIGSRRAAQIPKPAWLGQGELYSYTANDDVESLERKICQVDTVVHLASPNEIICGQEPERAIVENGVGTLRLCQAAKHAGVKKLIFFSTAHVYKAPLEGEFNESSLCEPVHPYAYSHMMGERIVHSFAGKGGIESCLVVRLTNAIGAPERFDVDRWTLLANDLCRQAITHHSLTLNSDGTGLRDFISLGDVAKCLAHLINRKSLENFEIFNLGSGRTISLLEMAKLIADEATRFLDRPIGLRVMQEPKPGVVALRLQIVIDKLKRTGFEWQHDFAEEIRNTLQLCKENL